MRKNLLIISFLLPVCFCSAQGQAIRDEGKTITVDYSEKQSILEITWLNPMYDLSTYSNRDLSISIGLKYNYELKSINVFLNGERLPADRGFKIVPVPSLDFNKTIEIPVHLQEGPNLIKVEVENEKGLLVSTERNVMLDIPSLNRKDYALIIGTNDYDYWGQLANPVFDAQTIAKELQENYGFLTELVLNPIHDSIMTKLIEYSKKSYMPSDQLFIFFAGHGQFDENLREGYLVCKDSKLKDLGKQTYFSQSQLRTIINNLPCNHIFLIMDVCYGGSFDQRVVKNSYRGDEFNSQTSKAEYIRKKLQYRTRRYLTSGGLSYVSDGVPGHNSPFTRKLLEAFRSFGGGDNILTSYEVYISVENLDPAPVFNEFGDNEPGSDFIFVTK